jgi:O-antigen/teichoic acid export membrane protein
MALNERHQPVIMVDGFPPRKAMPTNVTVTVDRKPENINIHELTAPARDVIPARVSTFQRWLPIIAKFAFLQGIVQLLAFCAGIIIVRTLPKRQYAFYTIGNTMLATILVLADSGISSALNAIGGRVWHDQQRLRSLLNTALQLRRQLAVVTTLVIVPILIWLLVQNGADALTTLGVVGAALAGSALELVTRIYIVALRLRSEIAQIQSQALAGAVIKLAVVGLAIGLFLNATIALLSVVIAYAVQFWMLRRWVNRNLERNVSVDPLMRSEIVSVLRRQAPHNIYYCIQGQVTVWLVSIFGNSENVANVGALGRLVVVFALLSSVMEEIVLPAFSRIQSIRQLRQRYLQIVCGYFVFSILLVALVAVFPDEILSILGSQYSNLHSEGILVAACGLVSSLAGLLWATNAARAWIVPPWFLIPCTLAVQAALAGLLKLSTVDGVLWFTIFTWIPSIVFSIGFAIRKMWASDGNRAIH